MLTASGLIPASGSKGLTHPEDNAPGRWIPPVVNPLPMHHRRTVGGHGLSHKHPFIQKKEAGAIEDTHERQQGISPYPCDYGAHPVDDVEGHLRVGQTESKSEGGCTHDGCHSGEVSYSYLAAYATRQFTDVGERSYWRA